MNSDPRWFVLTPFLIAGYLALLLLGPAGATEERRSDFLGTLVLFMLTAAAAWLASRVTGSERRRRVVASALIVLCLGLFGTARLLLLPQLAAPFTNTWLFLACWVLPFAAMILMLARSQPPTAATVRFLAVASALLLAFQGVGAGQRLMAQRTSDTGVLPVRAVADQRSSARPDIVVLVLDMFSSPRSMREYYDVNLDPFIDSLTTLGFAVPRHARTNYVHTGLVLSSFLNSRLTHTDIGNASAAPWETTSELIQGASVWETLRGLGYRLAFFPTGYEGTREHPTADMVFTPPERPSAQFGQTWILNTPAELLRSAGCRGAECAARSTFPIPIEGPAALRWKLSQLTSLPDSAGPIVAFLHFMGSHEPFVFHRDCSPRTPWWPRAVNGPDSLEIQRAYADQIVCVSGLLLDAVSNYMAKSDVAPVIILQADHGNGNIRIDALQARTVSVEEATQRQLRERLEVFAAYRFPGATGLIPDTVTPASALARVLNATLGLQLPLPPEPSYWSTWQDPLRLTEMWWHGDSVVTRAPGPVNAP